MRKVILKQNVRASGRLFELGSLKIYDETVPINMGFDFNKPGLTIVGYANRLMLDTQSGEVSIQINFKPEFGRKWDREMSQMYDFTIYADQVEATGSVLHDNQIISSCRLRAVVLVPIASMPIPRKK